MEFPIPNLFFLGGGVGSDYVGIVFECSGFVKKNFQFDLFYKETIEKSRSELL